VKNHRFHGNWRLSREKANFTENVMVVESRINLVPTYHICGVWTESSIAKFAAACYFISHI